MLGLLTKHKKLRRNYSVSQLKGLLKLAQQSLIRYCFSSAYNRSDLTEWVIASRGSCEDVRLVSLPGQGLTLHAAKDIAVGTELVCLPRRCLLTIQDSAPVVQSLSQEVPADLWPAQLALQLLAQRAGGSASCFRAYIANLPIGVPGLPLFFSSQEVEALQYPPLVQQVKLRGRWLAGFAAHKLASLPGTADDPFCGIKVDANLLGWGMAICSSRAFKVGSSQTPALLPLIDLANHSLHPNCRVTAESDDGSVSLVAKEDISAKQPLEISYGPLSNTLLLQDYGFILPGNPHDDVAVSLSLATLQAAQLCAGLQPATPIHSWQKGVLLHMGMGQQSVGARITRTEPHFDWRLIAAARILSAGHESAKMSNGDLHNLERWAMQDFQQRDNLQGLHTLRCLCDNMLAVFPTDLQEDSRQLQATAGLDRPSNLSLAIQYRMEIKSVLMEARSYLENIISRFV